MIKVLIVAEDADAPVQEQTLKAIRGMGEITVKAFFVKNLQMLASSDYPLAGNLNEAGKIPEKALKGLSLSHKTS